MFIHNRSSSTATRASRSLAKECKARLRNIIFFFFWFVFFLISLPLAYSVIMRVVTLGMFLFLPSGSTPMLSFPSNLELGQRRSSISYFYLAFSLFCIQVIPLLLKKRVIVVLVATAEHIDCVAFSIGSYKNVQHSNNTKSSNRVRKG